MAEPTPALIPRSLYRGDTRVWTHVFADGDGEPFDITGWEFIAEFRADLNRGDIVCVSACEVTDGPGGVMVETLTATEADKLPGQTSPSSKPKVYWDLQSTDLDGNVLTWQRAVVEVTGDASDD